MNNNNKVEFIVCAYRRIGSNTHAADQWYTLYCKYCYYSETISIQYADGEEAMYAINDFPVFWDLPVDAGILGIIDQAEKGLF